MTAQEQVEPVANPYNSRKPWHDVEEHENVTADELFFEDTKATQDSAPSKKKSSTNYKKRYDDLKRHYDEKVAEFKQREAELVAMAEAAKPQFNPNQNEETEAYVEPVQETPVEPLENPNMDFMRKRLAEMEQREKQITRREAEAKLRERHPDFAQIRDDEQFHAWAKEQPEQIQDWIYRNPDNVSLASRAIDFYKMEKGLKIHESTPSSKRPSKDAADFVSTKTTGVDAKAPRIWTQKEIARLSIDEFAKYEQEIDLAIQEGRVR